MGSEMCIRDSKGALVDYKMGPVPKQVGSPDVQKQKPNPFNSSSPGSRIASKKDKKGFGKDMDKPAVGGSKSPTRPIKQMIPGSSNKIPGLTPVKAKFAAATVPKGLSNNKQDHLRKVVRKLNI